MKSTVINFCLFIETCRPNTFDIYIFFKNKNYLTKTKNLKKQKPFLKKSPIILCLFYFQLVICLLSLCHFLETKLKIYLFWRISMIFSPVTIWLPSSEKSLLKFLFGSFNLFEQFPSMFRNFLYHSKDFLLLRKWSPKSRALQGGRSWI